MSKQDKALIVVATIGIMVAGAAWMRWRDRRFVEVAQSIDACDEEAAVLDKTASLGAPAADERHADARVVTWRRGSKVLTVSFVTPPSGKLVVGAVRLRTEMAHDPAPDAVKAVLYEDTSGLRRCR